MINDKKIYKIIKKGRISDKDFLTLYEYAINNNLYEYVISTDLSEEEKVKFIGYFNSRLEFEILISKRAIQLLEKGEDSFLQTVIKEKWKVENIFNILESFYYNEIRFKELIYHKGKNDETFFTTYVQNIKLDSNDFEDSCLMREPSVIIDSYDEIIEKNKKLNFVNESFFKEIIANIISNHTTYFLEELFLREEEEGKRIIEKIYGDINKNFSEFIFELAAIHPELVANNLYKILGWGFDPNLVSEKYNETLLIMIINEFGADEIIDFLKECIKYNYDVNDPALIKKIAEIRHANVVTEDEDEDIYDLYEFLCANKFDTYKSSLVPDESYKKTSKFFTYRTIIDGLKNKLVPLELEENFETKLAEVYDDIYNLINGIVKISGFDFLADFIDLLSEEIIKNRNESLNNTSNEFTVKELLDNLMSILFNNVTAVNNKIEDIKVKKLNY